MSAYTTLLYERIGAVLKITANRPDVLNAQSRVLLEELDDAFIRAAEDGAVRVIVLAGAGKHFSAGHDLGSREEMADEQKNPVGKGFQGEYRRLSEREHHAVARHPQAHHRPGPGLLHHGRHDDRLGLRHRHRQR